MPAAKQPSKKPQSSRRTQKKSTTTALKKSIRQSKFYNRVVSRPTEMAQNLLRRRPHRSLRRTRRRDYVRSLKMPGYISFTKYVSAMVWKNKKTFILLAVIYALLNGALVGLGSQDIYTQLVSTLKDGSESVVSNGLGQIGQTGLLVLSIAGGGLNGVATSDAQQIFGFLLSLMLWLTTIWLLRAYLAGNTPRLRDGLYNASSPLISLFLVAIVAVIQLLPLALAIIGFGAATAYGLFDGGLAAMLFWIVALLLGSLSLYWMTSTFIAMIVVTLPGMYPWQAIRTAGDLAVGRRVRILLRLLWMALMIVVVWAIIMIPVVLLVNWLTDVWQQISWVPIVPIALLMMTTATLIWATSYIYLLYRKVVDDDTKPA